MAASRWSWNHGSHSHSHSHSHGQTPVDFWMALGAARRQPEADQRPFHLKMARDGFSAGMGGAAPWRLVRASMLYWIGQKHRKN